MSAQHRNRHSTNGPGLCTEIVRNGAQGKGLSLIDEKRLSAAFRFEFGGGVQVRQKREIRQNFGEFWLAPVKDLTFLALGTIGVRWVSDTCGKVIFHNRSWNFVYVVSTYGAPRVSEDA